MNRSGKLFYTVQHLHLMDVYNLIFQKRGQNYLVKWPTGSDGVCFHQETLLYRYLHEMFRKRVHKKKKLTSALQLTHPDRFVAV